MEDPRILDDDLAERSTEQAPPRYAGFGSRVGAALVDFLVLAPLVYLNFYNFTTIKSLSLALLLILLTSLYKPVLEYLYGATVGKMVVSIKVVDYQYQPITADQALLRYLPWLIGNVISVFSTTHVFQLEGFEEATDFTTFSLLAATSIYEKWSQFAGWIVIISALGMLFNQYKQAVHDQIARTYCIHVAR